jgi:hypothetical protein
LLFHTIPALPCPGEAGALPAVDRALLAGQCPGLASAPGGCLTLVILVAVRAA